MEDNKDHPCQGMADLMTLREMYGRDLRGRKVGVTWTWGSSTTKPIAPHHDLCMSPACLALMLFSLARLKCGLILKSKLLSKQMWKLMVDLTQYLIEWKMPVKAPMLFTRRIMSVLICCLL
jgi:hypothetical protein